MTNPQTDEIERVANELFRVFEGREPPIEYPLQGQWIIAAKRAIAAIDTRRENEVLREALKTAVANFQIIQSLNSHGASDQTYIGWLRNSAAAGEQDARAALTNTPKP
jgi:hypothetical protein